MIKKINLQLFAEGATGASEGSSSGEASQAAAETGRKDTQVVYGKQVDTAEEGTNEPKAPEKKTFEELIKGDYKKDFDDRVHQIIGKKTATIKSMQEQYDKISPVLELISRKYGIDASDIESLTSAIESDNTYYEEEAIERGMSVEQLRQLKQIERENEILKQTIERNKQQTESDRIYNEWMDQAESLKEIYPGFDFMTEAENNDFAQLLRNGIDVKTAYEVIHKDEIIQGAMAVTAQKVKEKVTNDIRANGNRASENGTSSQASVVYKKDVNSLSREDRRAIEKLVARGEKISF